MAMLGQGGAIICTLLLIAVTYYIFLRQDLISTEQVANSICLDKPGLSQHLCMSCIRRSQFSIANESSIFISDATGSFKVVKLPFQQFLTCEETLQLVSYDIPIGSINDIRFENIGPIQQLTRLLHIEMAEEPTSKSEIQSKIQSVAIFTLKKIQSADTVIISYSSAKSQAMAKYYGQILAQCSLIIIVFSFFFFKFQKGIFKPNFLTIIAISVMILGECMLPNSSYLIKYAMTLAIAFYFISNFISRSLTVLSIAISLFSQFTQYEIVGLATILLIYTVKTGTRKLQKVSALAGFSIITFIICSAFRQHHQQLSLSLRKIIEYTVLNVTPLFIQLIGTSDDSQKYEKVPENSGPPGLSLPGFEYIEEDNQSS